ncbi:MAG: alanine racemase [Gammaproteobacteria bacterium]|nr:MAG: alanine racemase [Gammaproteobacteria bacterium]
MTPAAVAVVSAGALRHNLRNVRERTPGCRVLAVIKADAYGHGLIAVARALDDADGLAVARMEEAVRLREAGITRPIVVLGGFIDGSELEEAVHRGLDVVVHDPAQIERLEQVPARIDVWLKIDTGMGRLGIAPGTLLDSLARLRARPAGGTVRLMTHLAAADDPVSTQTATQLAAFEASVVEAVAQGWVGEVSFANSAGILAGQAIARDGVLAAGQANWVRPGLMLYGASPLPDHAAASLGLAPAMSFESRLLAVRRLPRGSRVGYGGDWQAARDSVIGVAAAGYADGYPWHSSCGTPVLVNGQRAPVIGRVSMDMISIDLTEVPLPGPGDRVVLWGNGLPVEEVARCAGTIPYELLAGMGPRVLRQVAG